MQEWTLGHRRFEDEDVVQVVWFRGWYLSVLSNYVKVSKVNTNEREYVKCYAPVPWFVCTQQVGRSALFAGTLQIGAESPSLSGFRLRNEAQLFITVYGIL
jgi:hypothetical protein